MLKEIFKSGITTAYEDERGYIFSIQEDNSRRRYYKVTARRPGELGKTIATRCTWETAQALIRDYQ